MAKKPPKRRKAVRKDVSLHIRVTAAQKELLVEAATSASLGLGPWMLTTALRQAKRDLSGQ